MKRHLLLIGVGLLLTAVMCLTAGGFIHLGFISRLEAQLYDLRLNITAPRTIDPRIVIVDIDEKSLAEEGRWPWSRDRLALLLDQLFDKYGIAVVGFDVVFAEEDTSSGMKVLERLSRTDLKGDASLRRMMPELKKTLDYDLRFGSRMKDRPVVMGYYFTGKDREGGRTSGVLPSPVFTADTFKGRSIPFVNMIGFGANLAQLQQNAASAGHFNPYIDPDGVCRRVPILIGYRGNYYESLSVAVVRTLFGNPPLTVSFPEESGGGYDVIEKLHLADLEIPVDEQVCTLVPYRGGQGSFPYVSAVDVLRGRVPAEQLEGAIVLVGTTAPGLMEHRSTPVSSVYAGVEVHANLIAGMLDQNFRHRPGYTRGAEIGTLAAAGVILSVALPFLGPLVSTLLSLGILGGIVSLNTAAWQNNLVLPLATSLLLVALLYTFNMTCGFFAESRARRRITGLFGQYIPPELVAEMSHKPDDYTMEGQSREMTVFFSDIRSFTTISEQLDPIQLSLMMNEYLTPMTRIIHRHRGTVDKYIGDAIMAFWGAPLEDPDHAEHGVRAALGMREELVRLRARFKEKGWPEIYVGMGLNTGNMSVGNMGSEFRRAYTVLGDAVNLGSRLESLTKAYGVDIIISESVRERANDIVCRELDVVRVKGKEQPVAIFEPLGFKGEVSEAVLVEAARFEEALSLYRSRDWQAAGALFRELATQAPGSVLYAMYCERIAHFEETPPAPDWDGVFRFETKSG